MGKERWLVTLGAALLMIGVIGAGDKIGNYHEIQTEVEVVQYWKESDSVLATTGEQG